MSVKNCFLKMQKYDGLFRKMPVNANGMDFTHKWRHFPNPGKPRRRSADQRLCFRYTDSTIPLLPNGGRGGSVVELWTLEREVQGWNPMAAV